MIVRAVHTLVVMVVGALLASMFTAVPAHADPAEDGPRPGEEPGAFICPPRDRCQVDVHINAFNAGRLGNAGGYRLPAGIRQRLNAISGRMAADGRLALGEDGKWWRHPLRSMQCLSTTFAMQHCNPGGASGPDQDAFNQKLEDSSQLMIICGGAVAIGFSRRGGWWGAGQGALACLWTTVLARRWDW